MRVYGSVFLFVSIVFAASCGDGDAEIQECSPPEACSCVDGIERDTSCSCVGGASCSVDGDNIEFQCDGNADCNLTCGTNCLITCPGTTACTVDTGDDAVIECPGTASCDITCQGDCTVNMAGNAESIVRCLDEADGAVCEVTGCSATSCGDGVSACRTSCP